MHFICTIKNNVATTWRFISLPSTLISQHKKNSLWGAGSATGNGSILQCVPLSCICSLVVRVQLRNEGIAGEKSRSIQTSVLGFQLRQGKLQPTVTAAQFCLLKLTPLGVREMSATSSETRVKNATYVVTCTQFWPFDHSYEPRGKNANSYTILTLWP